VVKGSLWSFFLKRFWRNHSSDNIESNTKTLCNENETTDNIESNTKTLCNVNETNYSFILILKDIVQ
jgi:hypothetical protein